VRKSPRSPYPPDPAEDAAPALELAELEDSVATDLDWSNQQTRRLGALRAEVRRCRLTGTELAEAALIDVTFSDCRLDLVGLRFAKLERVVFRNCRMEECDFYGATLTDVLFESCELRGARFGDVKVKRVELRGCGLAEVDGVDSLRGARMPWNDVLQNAPLFATALGLEIVD
jgi:uncharacterized protein YjbI with pentapeptide repeats